MSVSRDWTDGSMGSLAGESRPRDSFGPNIIAELRDGRVLQLGDIGADPRPAPYADGYASIPTQSLMVVPLLKEGELKAVPYLHCAAPRRPAAHGEGGDVLVPASGCEVLIVHDNNDAASTLAMPLELHGHTVRMAHDGVDALALLKGFTPRVAFLGFGMPRLKGYETARAIRQMVGLEHLCLVALTGWGADADRDRSGAAGFNFHLTKPVQLGEIARIWSASPAERRGRGRAAWASFPLSTKTCRTDHGCKDRAFPPH